MLFNSFVFLYYFLPLVMSVYFIINKKYRNLCLSIFSLIFYWFGETHRIVYMLLVIIVSYVGAQLMSKTEGDRRHLIFFASVSFIIALLVSCKYSCEILSMLAFCGVGDATICSMPIGMSFYSFQAISYLTDLYRSGKRPNIKFGDVFLFISLFPQLVAGPIIKYSTIAKELVSRDENFEDFMYGIKRFIIGLGKKVVLADCLGEVVDKAFSMNIEYLPCSGAWCGAIFYTLQLYLDFSGYSDMAIGLGRVFGFHFLENFNYPYISKSVTEFWRRWHISLSSWFKEYVYIPLGGNKLGLQRTLLNLLIVFLITGIWHGSSWNFFVWGLWNGAFIVIEKVVMFSSRKTEVSTENAERLSVGFFKHLYLLFVVIIGFVIFRSPNMHHCMDFLSVMFGLKHNTPLYLIAYFVPIKHAIILSISILASAGAAKNVLNFKGVFATAAINIYLLIVFLTSTVVMVVSSYNPFIYFRF